MKNHMDLFNLKGYFGFILVLVMCFCIISCGSDDENAVPGAQNVPHGKRLVSILTDGLDEYPSIKYDSYGRLSQIEKTHYSMSRQHPYDILTSLYTFYYKGDTLIVDYSDVLKSGEIKKTSTYKYVLNSRGYISELHSAKDEIGSEYEVGWKFEYDDYGSLVNFKGATFTYFIGEGESKRFTYSDGNVINTTLPNNTYRNYVYSNYENKANIVLNDIMYAPHNLADQIQDYTFDYLIGLGVPTVLYHAGFLGKANKNLVQNSMYKNKQKSNFTYGFDSEGYPNYIEVVTERNDRDDLVMHFFLAYE